MTNVLGNEWHRLDPAAIGELEPSLTVSVVIPSRGGGHRLERLLRSLAHQTYPARLLEIIVCDDGSEPPLEVPTTVDGADVRTVRLEDDGRFGAGRARNAGARAATGDVLLFLDADLLADTTAIEALARWFHVAPYAVLTGRLGFFDDEAIDDDALDTAITSGRLGSLLAEVATDDQAYREKTFARTFDLTLDGPDLFRIMIGAVMGVSRSLHEEVGGLRELGLRGIEDTEYGYRLHTAGGLFVLEREAALWHQGRRHFDSDRAKQTKADRAPLIQDLIAAPTFREPATTTPTVPTVLVDCRADEGADLVVAAVTATTETDVVCLIDEDDDGIDSRVRAVAAVAPIDLDAVPIRVRFAPEVRLDDETFVRIVERMRDPLLGVLHLVDDGGRELAEVTATRAVGRARLEGIAPEERLAAAGRAFGEWWLPAEDFGVAAR